MYMYIKTIFAVSTSFTGVYISFETSWISVLRNSNIIQYKIFSYHCGLTHLNTFAETSLGPRQANLVLIAYASSEGSGETARMRRLAWTFAARMGDKYQIRLTRSIYNVPTESGSCVFCNYYLHVILQDSSNNFIKKLVILVLESHKRLCVSI